MTKLVTVADIRLRKKKLAVAAEIDTAIENAIEGATVMLEGKLNTEFLQATLTHTYRINVVETPLTGQFSELFLEQGFVDITTPPVVKVSGRVEDLDGEEELVLGTEFHVKEEKGIILIDHFNSVRFGKGLTPSFGGFLTSSRRFDDNFFARVTYTAGLTESGGFFDDVPAWLKEAAVVATIIIMEQQSPVTKPEFGDKLSPKNQTAWNHLLAILDRRGRFFGAAIQPMF